MASELALKSPGKISHSRWLTTANRVLRLYASTSEPSESLILIVDFIVKVYIPSWFTIKKNSSAEFGAPNVFKTIEALRLMSPATKKIVCPVIQRNAFFAHPENLLLAMLCDQRAHVRELAWRRIRAARLRTSSSEELGVIRRFLIPDLNFDASDYFHLIDWTNIEVTEPPLTKKYSDEEIMIFIEDKHKICLDKFPCHTQAVERLVKIVTEASLSVCGSAARDGLIRSKIESRCRVPTLESKQCLLKIHESRC